MNVYICVLQRGNVIVGQLRMDGGLYYFTKAAVIRTWGTSKGLGQLAREGPLKATILDTVPEEIMVHEYTTIMSIKCVDDKWKDYLNNHSTLHTKKDS